ncbi:sigma-54-dependent Fis family transcriptional regulator [Clostridium pasteurianum]|uniref:Transcriptional regulator containing PAS, AAA-type ATPase, and DNA-binding domains n=1 Tax=Clostridium pasteurianum BC1 TaxID=86416 RepID=R4KFR4_CLOPA|nr:sigma-54-dependent Fis family transcriptional regulator [Clostridium pasteurianum]AGK98450.1 transcriptional regulator containing PAS, AAA-type ATPase, and DNA-binding domains [Clostridium pasteurianum BC1]
MINIVFVVPYPEMEKDVREVFDNHPKRNMLYENISVVQAEEITVNELEGDIVIARGLTFNKIEKYKPQMPKIELSISTLDIINALKKCRDKYKPKKIAFIGEHESISEAEPFFDLLGCDTEVYSEKYAENIPSVFQIAKKNCCDAFVGGYSVYRFAKFKNEKCVLVKTGKEAILRAINEAIRTYEILKSSRISKIIIEHSKESILYVGKDFKISLMNPEAQSYLEKIYKRKNFYDRHIKDVFPFMYHNIKNIFLKQKEINNDLHKIETMNITATYIPIVIGDEVTGVVINFTSVEKVQQDEIQIRKKLSTKGLYAKYNFDNIIYKSKLMYRTIEQAKKIAQVSSNVLIIGETGTGKELFAQSIHNASPRKNGPFVAINCASLPENLIESELFGYTSGAFTNAVAGGKAGLMELAHNGTLFLDEISEVPIAFQSKLLRVLQEHEVRRIGDDKTISVNVRIISALNRNIYKLVEEGVFRKDLLYRLDVLRLHIPSLNSRAEDTLELFMHYISIFNDRVGSKITSVTPSAVRLLENYKFEGNVRELKNIVERVCVLSSSDTINYSDMYNSLYSKDIDSNHIFTGNNMSNKILKNSEKEIIEQALIKTKFNKKKAAELLEIDRTTLWRKMKKMDIK